MENNNLTESKSTDKTLSFLIDYEIRGSWWASYIYWSWGQELAAKYFSWKVCGKYIRYLKSKEMERIVNKSHN